MAHLACYQDFLERVEELGFLPLSHFLPDFPSVSDETVNKQWHTGDRETDPWVWKDRAAEEKRLAYGCILGGHKGFVARRMYPVFYAACRPGLSMPSRWSSGLVNQTTWQLWQLFQMRPKLDISSVRRQMHVTAKKGGSRVDASLQELEAEYYLTRAGSCRKIGKDGQPYGWAVTVYMRVVDWAPQGWLDPIPGLSREAAWEQILDLGEKMGKNVDRGALAKKLGAP